MLQRVGLGYGGKLFLVKLRNGPPDAVSNIFSNLVVAFSGRRFGIWPSARCQRYYRCVVFLRQLAYKFSGNNQSLLVGKAYLLVCLMA
mgnify:CR=1 FL=1